MSEMIVVPQTGEVLDVKSAPNEMLLEARDKMVEYETDLKSFKRAVDDELIERMTGEGLKTWHVGGHTITASKATERVWDLDLLQDTLARLVKDQIITEAKRERCLRLKVEPVAREIAVLEDDPRCQMQIRACYEERPANRYVRVA